MAYSLLSRIDGLADKLLQLPSQHSHGLQVQENIEALQRMVRRIQAVLDDAEKREIHDKSVKLWLWELKGVTYDADDVLDQYEYELLRLKVEASIQADEATQLLCEEKYQQVSESATTAISPDASVWDKIADRIGKIRGRFEEISEQRVALHLREGNIGESPVHKTAGRPQSSHLVDASTIYGRTGDLEKVMDQLLYSDECKQRNLSVLPIVGMGGVGKTVLVQHLYHDQKVCDHFPLKGWVCVSDDFTVEKLTARIIESFTREVCNLNELSILQEKLKGVLGGERFLLVLDDVWNENPRLWESLQKPLRFGVLGSAVIATTRNDHVAKIMQTMPFHRLNCLTVDDCWEVFKRSAFFDRDPDDHQDLVEIGKEIVKKCGGLPLAAKSLGGLLSNEEEVDKWEEVLQNDIWDLGDQGDGVLPALRLSYLQLPCHLKQCFLYACIFPKDFRFIKDDLILLWMAQGFLRCKSRKQAEDVGNTYFNELVQRSFFQHSTLSPDEEDPHFVMHDLIHDLAEYISGREFFHIAEKAHVPCLNEVRYVSVICGRVKDVAKMIHSPYFHGPCGIRTLMVQPRWKYPDFNFKLPSQMKLNLDFLRALVLSGLKISELPDSIGDLTLLRHLNLEGTWIERLPDSVCRLYNLQTLSLKKCFRLSSLPENIGGLCNLRCLKIVGAGLYFLPGGIGKLTSLHALDKFIVGIRPISIQGFHGTQEDECDEWGGLDAKCSGIVQLKDLKHLRGTISISNLQYVMNGEDARLADLTNKRNIRVLSLYWEDFRRRVPSPYWEDDGLHNASPSVQTQVLENLRPPDRLQMLTIHGYAGLSFPSWMADDLSPLSVLVRVDLHNCEWCTSLPPLGQLPSLKHLAITNMDMVEAVGPEFCGHAGVGFPALEKLEVRSMPKWVTWEPAAGRQAFPRLRRLLVASCRMLKSTVPLCLLPALEELHICYCPVLESIELCSGPSSSSSLPTGPPPLKNMRVEGCPSARFSPEEDEQWLLLPPTLRDLTIDARCPLLVKWCERGGGRRLAHIPNAQVSRLGCGTKMVSTSAAEVASRWFDLLGEDMYIL